VSAGRIPVGASVLGDHAVKYFWIAIVLALAAVGPNLFPAAQAGYSTLHVLAIRLLLPSILGLGLIPAALWRSQSALSRAVVWGAVAGVLATIPLEVVRLAGFHFDYMPGNLPRLMGVLLLDRFAEGPSTASDIAGWAYHFWNGASFGIIYAVLFGTRRRWIGALYGLLIGIGFMVSPVVKSLGVGYFGLQFSYGFPITVGLAHLGFGVALGFLARRFLAGQSSTLLRASAVACPSRIAFDRADMATRRA
jgi:hypothetical protein